MNSTPQWVHEPEAAELLAIKNSTLRTMRRDVRLDPGIHYLFATGIAGGPVVYDITAIRKTLAEHTVAMVQQAAKRRKSDQQARQQIVETYDNSGVWIVSLRKIAHEKHHYAYEGVVGISTQLFRQSSVTNCRQLQSADTSHTEPI